MIKRLVAYDFDGTLFNSPMPEYGKKEWAKFYSKEFPHIGWWSKTESLDTDVFNIDPYGEVLNQLNSDRAEPETYVIILTSRIYKLRPQIEKILQLNSVHVDELNMMHDNLNKGEKVLKYLEKFPDIETIDVYDDRDVEFKAYMSVMNYLPENVTLNIFKVTDGAIGLYKSKNSVEDIINEEILKLERSK